MLARRIYYLLKPCVNWRLRLSFRRWLAKRRLQNAELIWPILESAGQPPRGWTGWPGGKQFAFVLTHDVEGKRGLNRVTGLAEIEMELGFRSSFNFVPEGKYLLPNDLRNWLSRNGFEVGVHDLHHDGSLFRSYKDFRSQTARINYYIKEWGAAGFRAAFMFHNLDWIRDLNIEYDASTFDTDPFEPQPDSLGTIFPHLVPAKDERPGYIELPYTLVQDSTLFLVLQERTADVWKRKLDWVAQQGGMALVNIHPDYLAFDSQSSSAREFPAARYLELLTYLKTRYTEAYWHTLPRDLARWFRTSRAETRTGYHGSAANKHDSPTYEVASRIVPDHEREFDPPG
jgi:hypothetical protein